MKVLMRYKITSGRVVEKRDVLMDVTLDPTERRPRPRRGKYQGRQLAAQVERNLAEAIRRLARSINCNFGPGDLFMSLKYNNDRLPATREEAERIAGNFVRRLQRAYQKAMGKKLRWVLVTADRSSKTGEPVRLHHHLVIPAMDWEILARHWPDDQMTVRYLDGRGDYTGIARYMVQNAGYRRGHRTWRTSQGLDKPVYSAPEPVHSGAGSFRIPRQAVVMERQETRDEQSGFAAAYVRYVAPLARGGTGAGGTVYSRAGTRWETGDREKSGRREGAENGSV